MIYHSQLLEEIQWSVDIDVKRDLNNIAYMRLRNAGYDIQDSKDAIKLYFNLVKRSVSPQPREVFISSELVCPESYKPILQEFVKKVERGDDLRPFQSKNLLEADYNDLLLNDWNIQHFHLASSYGKNGFAKRSNYLLFAYVTATQFYIQIYAHKSKDLFSRQDMVRILHNNWPELIIKNRLKGVDSLTEDIDDHQYAQLRKKHVTTAIQIEKGCVYTLIGGGYMTSGLSMEVLRAVDYWHRQAQMIENYIVTNMPQLMPFFRSLSGKHIAELVFSLLLSDNDDVFTFREKNTNAIMQVKLNEGCFRICYPHEVFAINEDRIVDSVKRLPYLFLLSKIQQSF